MLTDAETLDMIGLPKPSSPESAPGDFVTAPALADFLGISTDVVSALGREGIFTRQSPPGWKGSYAYSLRESVRAYVGHLRIKANAKARPSTAPELAAAKLAFTEAQARKVELQNDKAAGRLIPADQVRADWLATASDLRNRLLAVAPRVAATLSLDRPTAAALDREIRAAMNDLATSEGADL
ncbi:MAG: hypothetical protein ACK4RZ_01595 [Paracoccaceae bacterium]